MVRILGSGFPWMNGKSVIDMFPNINIKDADIFKKARIA